MGPDDLARRLINPASRRRIFSKPTDEIGAMDAEAASENTRGCDLRMGFGELMFLPSRRWRRAEYRTLLSTMLVREARRRVALVERAVARVDRRRETPTYFGEVAFNWTSRQTAKGLALDTQFTQASRQIVIYLPGICRRQDRSG